jgi:hypothetical protein
MGGDALEITRIAQRIPYGTPQLNHHGTNHLTPGPDPVPLATQAADGLMGHADKAKLDQLQQGGQIQDHDRDAHLWPVWYTAIAIALALGDAPAEGVEMLFARSDHKHGMPTLYEQPVKTWAGGADLTWVLDHVPNPQIVLFHADRGKMIKGVDYTLSGATITIIGGPLNAGVVSECVFFY